MEIKIRNKNGIILQTKDKICDDNIIIKLDSSLIPSGTLDITENGTHNVEKYAEVNVNVEGSGGVDTTDATATPQDILLGKTAYVNEEKVEGTIPTYDGSANEDVTPLEDAIISGATIDTYTNNRITKVASFKFREGKIRVFNSTSVTSLNTQAFYGSTLEECNTPNLTSLAGSSLHSTKLTKANFQKLTGVMGAGNFTSCTSLLYAHIGKPSRISQTQFQSCSKLQAVIIESTSVPTLDNVNAFSSSGIANGIGFIYVLDTLVENFKTATNWSTYVTQFKPISELPQEIKDELGME